MLPDEGICNTLACGLHNVGVAQYGDHQYIALFHSYHINSVVYHENTILTAHILHACAVSMILSCLTGHSCKNIIRVLSWNIMGSTNRGWARVRKQVVQANIKGYDMVLLQEVPWVKTGTKKRLADPAGYKLVMSESANRHSCILYNPQKLQCEDDDTTVIKKSLKSVKDWAVHSEHFNRLCVQVFSPTAMGGLSKFVAISLYAPRSNTKPFCNVVKASIKKVVAVHKLPVLVGGDFNTDIYDWKNDGFLGLHEARHKRIDFIVMKVPKRSHLKIVKVQVHEDIAIPAEVQKSEVMRSEGDEMISVKDFTKHYTHEFYRDLCDSHMPLTAEIEYHEKCEE